MPFDDFVIAAMKDTGDSREEVIAFASEAFRSQYQAADGYLRAAHDSSTMYNAFDIEIDDKTYYATAPLEWVKEQARATLSDKGWDLENARHNFLHSSLDEWETAFHQLKAAADDYKQWRNQVCAFFNFRQPEITLQEDEWTQVAQFVNYNQEWEQLDNARLLIAEFTPQQAFEFLGVYQQYQRYVSLAEHNAEQGIDSPELRTQIAALEQSLNEKVAQNLPQTENRQVMFDLFGTQMNLFDEIEKTQEQGTTTPEKNNLDDLDELHIKFTNALEELSPERQAELYPLVRDLGFEFIRLRQDCKELRAGNVEKSLNKIFELQNAIISKRQDYFVKGNDTDLAIEQAEHNRRVLMFVFKTKVGDRDFIEKLNDINYDFYKIIETHYQQTPAGQNDLFKRLDSELSRLNERLAWLRRNLETEKSFLQQAESSNVAVEVEYHKQTIDSINVGIAKNETEQNKLKLDANGFNQTPESQVLLQQLKEKFPHLWQSETQEQGISTTEPRLGDKVILQNGVFYPVISRIADEKFSLGRNAPDKDFIDTIKTNGEIPVSVDEYKQIAKMKNELWYCENTKEFVFMGGVENNYMFRNIRNEEYYGLKEFLQQLKDRQPETVKTLNPKEQALADGKAMTAADEKVGDTKWELAKQPNNPERQAAYQQAITERQALHNEVKQRVSDAMDKGEPYIIRYDEVPTAPFNGEKAPIELVVTQKGNLRLAIGTLDKPHNLVPVDSTPEIALNAEQRSSPQRTAEVLRERFNQPTAVVADRLACINYPAEVFSEQEIKDTLNKALKSSSKTHQLAAIKSPVMRGEWLSQIADNPKATKEVRQAAKSEMAERYAESKPQWQAEKQSLKQTADKGGFSSPVVSEKQEKEEELATIADDDDDYGRD